MGIPNIFSNFRLNKAIYLVESLSIGSVLVNPYFLLYKLTAFSEF